MDPAKMNSCQLSSRALSRSTKLTLYETFIISILIYGSEPWTITTADVKNLVMFGRKILCKIFGFVCVNGEYRRGMNQELCEQYDHVKLARHVKIQRLCSLHHVIRINKQAPARRVFQSDPSGGPLRRAGVAKWMTT